MTDAQRWVPKEDGEGSDFQPVTAKPIKDEAGKVVAYRVLTNEAGGAVTWDIEKFERYFRPVAL